MVGHSMTRAPRSSSWLRSWADCAAARVMTIVLPVSAILRDLGQNLSGALGKQRFAKLETQFVRKVCCAADFVGDHARSIETRDQTSQRQPLSIDPGFARNRNLATSSERA